MIRIKNKRSSLKIRYKNMNKFIIDEKRRSITINIYFCIYFEIVNENNDFR